MVAFDEWEEKVRKGKRGEEFYEVTNLFQECFANVVGENISTSWIHPFGTDPLCGLIHGWMHPDGIYPERIS
jgi:hypothetical protein